MTLLIDHRCNFSVNKILFWKKINNSFENKMALTTTIVTANLNREIGEPVAISQSMDSLSHYYFRALTFNLKLFQLVRAIQKKKIVEMHYFIAFCINIWKIMKLLFELTRFLFSSSEYFAGFGFNIIIINRQIFFFFQLE